MKTFNHIPLVLLSLFATAANLLAQDSILNRNVTVEREYKPVINDAGKISSTPTVLEPVVEKAAPRYTEFNLPLDAGFNIHPLPAAELVHEKPQYKNAGFARFGLGSNFNTLADFAYPLVKDSDLKLDVSLNHYATFASKAHSVTNASLSFDKYYKNIDFYAGVGGGHEYLKYYGSNFDRNGKVLPLDTLAASFGSSKYDETDLATINRMPQMYTLDNLANDSVSETFWRFSTYAGIRSMPWASGLRYRAEIAYKTFHSHYGLTENMLQTFGGFNSVSGKNRLGVDLQMDNLYYSSGNPLLTNFWNSYTVFAMNPFYSFERTDWNFRVGVKSSFSFVHGRPFNPSPDISFEWKAIPPYFAIYGGATGDYQVNSMNRMFAENRYLYPDIRVKDTYTPFEFYGGIKVKPLYNLLVDGFVDYRRVLNQYFFVNKQYDLNTSLPAGIAPAYNTVFTNRFNVIYSDASLLKIGIRANYNYLNRINVQFKGTVNKWNVDTEQYAWNKPKWEADLSSNIRLNRNLSLDGSIFVEGKRYAKLGNTAFEMKPKVDVNLGASYSYSNWFTVFAKVNNLINSSYQDYFGYDVQGFNVMAGAAFSF
ncbi:MAG TPA: hypothetical protein VK152_13220 [Paludibacter sp.]|nr:hypothetical protein [Paludibacter sp.]